MTPIEQAKQALSIVSELMDIQKRPHRFAIRDEADWMEKRLPELARLMDGVVADMEWSEEQDAIYGQLQLNSEVEKAAGEGKLSA